MTIEKNYMLITNLWKNINFTKHVCAICGVPDFICNKGLDKPVKNVRMVIPVLEDEKSVSLMKVNEP